MESWVLSLMILAAVEETQQGLDAATLVAPILSTGVVGIFLLMLLFRIKIMPTWVYDEAVKDWADERARYLADIVELKAGLKDAGAVYTEQVIPTLTRVLDSERELVELRRNEQAERRRRDQQ